MKKIHLLVTLLLLLLAFPTVHAVDSRTNDQHTSIRQQIRKRSKDDRVRREIFDRRNMQKIIELWERIWFIEAPDDMSPFRTHGGVI